MSEEERLNQMKGNFLGAMLLAVALAGGWVWDHQRLVEKEQQLRRDAQQAVVEIRDLARKAKGDPDWCPLPGGR